MRKNFYKEHSRVEERPWEDIDKFLNLHQIKFSGFDVPKPIFSLDEINFPDYIMEELRMQGINRPTAIQALAWPALYSGRDLMCIGLPTSSRVISYICPALVHVKSKEVESRKKGGPSVLIVTQTKEVAKDILTHSQMFMHQAQCTFCGLFDDENINTQALQLNQYEPDILIGNYHRLCELMDNNLVNLKNVTFLIMDDFYRNRSARLSDEIKRVVNEIRIDRQTAIYSRIVPSGLQKSNGDEFQNDAIFICVGNDDIHVPHKDLPQTIHICTMAEKKKKLQDLISEISEKEPNFKILVYANGFKKIRITEKIIKELGIDTFAYERTNVGRRRRAMKEKVYYHFNATPKSVLVASDVVSSKVELPDLNYIINADFPVNLSLYLNRMRTGIKKYISIFIAEDARHADRLIYVLNECRQEIPPILYKISEAYTNSGKDVDRMPSLQEIGDGLTKPVEKPIPKPLPPTVHLNPNNVTTAKKPLEEKLKQLQPLSNGLTTSTTSTTTSTATTTSTPNTPTSTSSSLTGIAMFTFKPYMTPNNDYNKRKKLFHVTTNNYSNNNTSSSSIGGNNRFNYNQKQQFMYNNNNNNNSKNPYSPPNQFNNTTYLSQSPTYPQQQYIPQILAPPPPPPHTQTPYNTSQSAYTNNYFNNTTASTNYVNNQQNLYNPQYIQPQQQQQQQQQYQHFTHSQPPPLQQQQQPLYQTAHVNGHVKLEPTEPTFNQQQYFTNPIPFKQEPTDITYDMAQYQYNNTNNHIPASSSSSTSSLSSSNNTEPTTIVNNLLKDQQVLNLLEKVAQAFRPPTQSTYQGSWNFQ